MKYIESKSGVASGHPVIKGTRIRVAHILKLRLDGLSLEDMHAWYPWVPATHLRGAIDEALQHIDRPIHA
ncbi:DUF433 domain-containing protein [Streptomyces sp. NPDC002156]